MRAVLALREEDVLVTASPARLIRQHADDRAGHRREGLLEIDLSLDLGGQQRRWTILVEDRPVRLAELVPLARQVADAVCDRAIANVAEQGKAVSCGKGCSACCHWLVPLSAPEALRLCEDLDALPAGRRQAVMDRFMAGARRILTPPSGPLDEFADGMPDTIPAIGRWYAQLELPCPLLERGECSAYQDRPIACRECLATTPPGLCQGLPPGLGNTIDLPFSTTHALALLAAELEGRDAESVILPMATVWRQINADRAAATWPAGSAFSRFAHILESMPVAAAAIV